jgi:hypothetical protein
MVQAGDLLSHKRSHVVELAGAFWTLRRFEPLGEQQVEAAVALCEAAPPLPVTARDPRKMRAAPAAALHSDSDAEDEMVDESDEEPPFNAYIG